MSLYQIVQRLVGPVNAIGESDADADRYNNLIVLMELSDNIIQAIATAALSRNRQEASMRKIGVRAQDYLRDLQETLEASR